MVTKFDSILSMNSKNECNGILILQQILDKRRLLANIYESVDNNYGVSYDDSYSDHSDYWSDSW